MTVSKAVPMIQVAPDFRRARYAEWCHSEHLGKYVALLQCEEFVEGRWEPFLSEIGCDGVFYEPPVLDGPLQSVFRERGCANERIQ